MIQDGIKFKIELREQVVREMGVILSLVAKHDTHLDFHVLILSKI